MSFSIVCPSCGKTLRVPAELLRKQVRCGGCAQVFLVAAAAPQAEADEPLYSTHEEASKEQSGKATASLVLGILGLVGWCLPILGLPLTIGGLVLGIKGLSSRNHGRAVAGIVLNIIGLVLSVVNAAIGAYLGATGQHPLLR